MSAHNHEGGFHFTLKGYIVGFILAVILTVIPFYLVMSGSFDSKVTGIAVILGLAVVQIIVHMVYFLHMNTKSDGGWTFMAFIFTVILVVIVLVGSIWVMNSANELMMPHMTDHSQM